MFFFLPLFTLKLQTSLYNIDYDATPFSIGRNIINFNYNDDAGVKEGSNDMNLHIVWASKYLSFSLYLIFRF